MTKQSKKTTLTNKKTILWAVLAVVVAITVAALPYLAWGNLGGEPEVQEPIPEAVPISQADLDSDPVEETTADGVATEDEPQAEDPEIIVQEEEEPEESTEIVLSDDQRVEVDGAITGLKLEGDGTFNLVVNGELNCDVVVLPNQTLNLYGEGAINFGLGSNIAGNLNVSSLVDSSCPRIGGKLTVANGNLLGTFNIPQGSTLSVEGLGTLELDSLTVDGVFNNELKSDDQDVPLKLKEGSSSITVNGTLNSAIEVSNEKTLTIEGAGTVALKKSLVAENATLAISNVALKLSGELAIQNGAKLSGSFTVPSAETLTLNGGSDDAETTGIAEIKNLVVDGTFNNELKAEVDRVLPDCTGHVEETVKVVQPTALKLLDNNGHSWTINGTLNSAINVAASQNLTLSGSGIVDGTDKESSVVVVDGSGASLNLDGPTLQKGTGSTHSNYELYDNKNKGYVTRVGGGILVKNGAGLMFSSGTVSNNTAQAGGGIFVDRDCSFTMKSGTISGNKTIRYANIGEADDKRQFTSDDTYQNDYNAAHEGGGLYLACTGYIEGGTITNNKAYTENDWGGGGIFIESKGYLYLGKNEAKSNTSGVLITNNTADGLGGGISGCPHARAGINPIQINNRTAVAIYGNTAHKSTSLKAENGKGNPYLWDCVKWNRQTQKLDNVGLGDIIAYSQAAFDADDAMDYYCTYYSVVDSLGYPTKEGYSWKGKQALVNGADFRDVTVDDEHGQAFVQDGTLGLTAGTPVDKSRFDGVGIKITDNYSATHGGGIGCNGVLEIGSIEPSEANRWTVDIPLKKDFLNLKRESALDENTVFEFGLYETEECAPGTEVATATNDAKGNIDFVFDLVPPEIGAEPAKKTYYVKELTNEPLSFIDYDENVRKVELEYTRGVDTSGKDPIFETSPWSAGEKTLYYTNAKIKSIQVKSNGEWITETQDGQDVSGTFVNKVKALGSLSISKTLYGTDAEKNAYIFNLTQVEFKDNKLSKDDLEKKPTKQAKSPVLTSGKAETITFENIDYSEYIDKTVCFKITEDSGQDPTVYVIKVKPEIAEDGMSYKPTILEMYRGSDSENLSLVYEAPEDDSSAEAPAIEFNNYNGDLSITKKFVGGSAQGGPFTFNLTQVDFKDNKLSEDDLAKKPIKQAESPALTSGQKETVTFRDINYAGYTEDTPLWFMVTEDSGQDPSVYVIKVKPEPNEDGTSCKTKILEMYYGYDGPNNLSLLYQAGEDGSGTAPEIMFNNYDNNFSMAIAGYSVYASSGTPVELECFVDPKIVKELQGRPLKSGEFTFKLIQIEPDKDGNVDWSKTDGIVVGEGNNGEKVDYISQTKNDEYGMVDFDAANPLGYDEQGNPSCLSYTAPGTYYYRVVEVNESHDAAVNYAQDIITFTTVVERTDKGLECTQMYYGHVEDGKNIEYDMSRGNPTWHPTMTNYAKPIDLKVRKTSALTGEGLEGATYGLYQVSNGSQADLLLGEEKSDADGWVTFNNVSLSENGKYYFKEIAAPAGHTVSDLRTYFKIKGEPTAPNGYVIVYENAQQNALPQSDEDEVAIMTMADEDENGIMTLAGEDGNAADDASTLIVTYDNQGIGVQDEATLVEFAKVNADNGARVEGAELEIVEKDTGKQIASWTSGAENFKVEGKLDVEKTYILRETSAPDGFAKAAQVEFQIENYGRVEILRGATVASGTNADAQGATILLYDQPGEGDVGEPTDGQPGFLPKTGDMIMFGGVLIAVIAIIFLVAASARRRKKSEDEF